IFKALQTARTIETLAIALKARAWPAEKIGVRIPTQGERGFRRMVNGDSDDVERGFRRMLNDLAGMSEMLFKMPTNAPKTGVARCVVIRTRLSGSLPFSKG